MTLFVWRFKAVVSRFVHSEGYLSLVSDLFRVSSYLVVLFDLIDFIPKNSTEFWVFSI